MTVPVLLRVLALVAGLAVGGALIGSGACGMRGTLRRLGVRTPAAMRSAAASRLANRVAALPWIAGGAVAAAGGLLCLVLPGTGAVLTVLVVAVLGGLGIAAAGGVLGHRAAAALPDPAPAGPCAVCLCGGQGCGSRVQANQ